MLSQRDEPQWLSFHLFYHGDRNKVLTDFVRPAVSSLVGRGRIDSFFFVRYALGGPHVRLRVYAKGLSELEEVLIRAAREFLERLPSTQSLDVETLKRYNQDLLAENAECDERVFPDNSYQVFPFAPEVERYGGQQLWEHSLDFFAISSLRSLEHVVLCGDAPWAHQLSHIFRLLARQAFGFAEEEDEFIDLLGYAVDFWKTRAERLIVRGDEAFEKSREVYERLLRHEIESCLAMAPASTPKPGSAEVLAIAARQLSVEIRSADPEARRRILTSQLHMTANRLGMKNSEEVYLSRLLWRTARELRSTQRSFWRQVSRVLAERRRTAADPRSGDSLRAILGTLLSCGRI